MIDLSFFPDDSVSWNDIRLPVFLSFFLSTFAPACHTYKGNTKTALWYNLCTWTVTLCFGSWFHALDSDWQSCAHQQAKGVFWRFGECWPVHLGHVRSHVNPSDAHLPGTCSICVYVQHRNRTPPLLSCSTLNPYALFFPSLNADVRECILQSESHFRCHTSMHYKVNAGHVGLWKMSKSLCTENWPVAGNAYLDGRVKSVVILVSFVL